MVTALKKIVPFLLLGLLCACGEKSETKTIEIADYRFDFPGDFRLQEEETTDSYVGRIEGDSMTFYFDFGHYSNSFELTPQEYLNEGHWRGEDMYWYLQDIRQSNTIMHPMDVLYIRPATAQDSTLEKGCEYVARCHDDKGEFDYPIRIPDTIKQTNFEIDTVDGIYRKIVYAPNPRQGITGIYLRDLDGINASDSAYKALSMFTQNISPTQQEIALRIFRSSKRKK